MLDNLIFFSIFLVSSSILASLVYLEYKNKKNTYENGIITVAKISIFSIIIASLFYILFMFSCLAFASSL